MNSILGMFSIFDSKARAYLQPFFSINLETAKREFSAAVNGEGNFSEFTEDYSLFFLGNFNQVTGKFEMQKTAVHVCNAVTLKIVQAFAMTNGVADNGPRELNSVIQGYEKANEE